MPTCGEQIGEAFLRLTGRQPDDDGNRTACGKCMTSSGRCLLTATEQDALKFIQLGESKPDPTLAPADLAALAVTCQVILNLDATIYER